MQRTLPPALAGLNPRMLPTEERDDARRRIAELEAQLARLQHKDDGPIE